MRNGKPRIKNQALKEFVYSILYNASFESKRHIPTRFLKYVNSQRAAKSFIEKASTDDVIGLLSYLGIENFQVFVAKEHATLKNLKGILDKYKNDQAIHSLQDIIEMKLFVTSDKELITLLGTVAQTVHHKAYTMALELTRTGYHLHKWKKHLDADEETMAGYENSNVVAKTVLSSLLTLRKVEFLFRLRELDMLVLLYLFPLKNTMVSVESIYTCFVGFFLKNTVTASIKRLVASTYIRRSAITADRQYTITGLGVKVVNDFTESVFLANHFR